MESVDYYLREGLLKKRPFTSGLVPDFQAHARVNLQTMELLHKVNNTPSLKKTLELPQTFRTSGWMIIAGYYGMYMAAQAALAKIGLITKSHVAAIAALDAYYVKKKLIDEKFLNFLQNAELKKEQIQHLKDAREQREKAQYDITQTVTDRAAEDIRKNAYEFVNKIDEILMKT